jgi:amino acid adenylation domain-containing protein
MKTITELIAHLLQEKVELWLEGDRLRYRAPNQVMTPELLEQIKREKETIKQFLRQNQPITKLFPLSIGQRALWFLHQMAPDSPAYNIAFSARICSPVNINVLEQAFQSLVERHPLLRATFPVQAGEPVQAIHSYQKVALYQIDATDWPETELIERVQRFYQSPFNLEQGPLMRVHLFTRHPQDHILLITQHHIISDAWSLWLLLDEFRLLYSNLEAGIPLTLNPLPYTYSDYVERQKSLLEGNEEEKLGHYWQKQLENSAPVLNLPFDRLRPPHQSYQGASYKFDFSPVLSEQLKQLCQQENVTLYTLLLAAFQVLLHRYTSQEEILVGSPTSGRTQEEFTSVCGYFVNPIVLKANFANNPSFKSFLAQVRQTVLEGLAHQEYPFPLLVERLSPDRTASYSPIFQVDFVLQQPQQVEKMADLLIAKATDKVVNWGGLALKPFEMPQQEGQFDLGLEMIDTGESLIAVWKYDTALFDHDTLVRMAGHFSVLLEQIVAQPEQAIGDFSILTETEKYQILEEWNRTEVDYPLDKCIHQLFEEQVERTPDNIAVVYEEQQLTYRELNSRANQLAHYLQELGVKPDTLVGICLERSLEMVIGLLAILKAGGAYIPIDPTYPVDRIAYMIDNAQMSLLLTSTDLLTIFSVNEIPTVCLARDHREIAAYPDSNPLTSLKPHHLAYVIYTSGSTGQPKGVMIPHQAISNHMFWLQTTFPLTPEDKVLQKTPFSFDASVWEFYAPLLVGGQLIMAVPGGHQDSRYLIKEIINQQVTILQLVPSLLRMLLETDGLEQCSSLRRIFCGGEALERELGDRLQAILPVSLHNLYGPTEACIDATVYNYTPENSAEIVPIGRPIANTRVYILDAYQNPVPVGVTGELHIGGTGLARGYLHRPGLTEQKFITSPFCQDYEKKLYKTGDLTRYLADGQIEYLGRSDHQVKIRGFRIELTEIEAVLSQYPPIKQAIVLVKTDHLGARLVAYLLVPDDFSLDPLSLRDFLKKQLPDYMIPADFLVLTSWPLTPNGKVDRQALLSLELTSLRTQGYGTAPRNHLEVTLLHIWTEILETENLGIEDNFFEFGGHSLLAVRLLNQVEKHFHRKLSLAAFFQEPTIEGLAKLLSQTSYQISPVTLVPLQPKGDKSPFYCVHAIGGSVACYWQLSRCLKPERPFYGLQSPQLSDSELSFSSLEEMAQFYLAEIIARQPQGPYYLGGWSFGGLIAYEMARQLQARQQEVASLILLDTFAPVLSSTVLDLDSSQLMAFFATHLGGSLKPNDYLSHEKLRQIPAEEQLEYVFAWAVQHHLLPENLDSWQFKQLFLVFKNNLQLARQYRSLPYTGKIELFLANEQVELSLDWLQYSGTLDHELSILLTKSDRGWSEVIGDTGRIATYSISGNHYTMLQPPHIDNVVAKIENLWNM